MKDTYIKNISTEESILISTINSNWVIIPSEYLNNELVVYNQLQKQGFYNNLDKSFYTKVDNPTIYISLHASSRCNMACKYCFLPNKDHQSLSVEECLSFIDLVTSTYPNAEKYIIDPTGSAEPLLELDKILQIAAYCRQKSNELKREFLPMLVTNGLLLTPSTVQILRENGILFGVSLDGLKKDHDANRITKNNQKTFKQIMQNVAQIEDKTLLGAAVTLSSGKQNLVKIVKYLSRYFMAISIKPVRNFSDSLLNTNNLANVKKQYNKLYSFLLKETLTKQNFSYLQALLNGDDYFGKFVYRLATDTKVNARCDAGYGRFSLAPNGKIYACPGAINIDEMTVGGNNKIDHEKVKKLWELHTNTRKCDNCPIRYVCGGECFVVSYYQHKQIDKRNTVMCDLKRHLFTLAASLVHEIRKDTKMNKMLEEFCMIKKGRFALDTELDMVLQKLSNQYTFTELKKIKDDNPTLWAKIKQDC